MGLPAVRSRKRPIQQSSINNPDAFPSVLCEGKSIRIRKKHNIARRDGDEHEKTKILMDVITADAAENEHVVRVQTISVNIS